MPPAHAMIVLSLSDFIISVAVNQIKIRSATQDYREKSYS